MSFIYLASPYTPHNGESIAARVHEVSKAAAKLMAAGNSVFCPIVHSHALVEYLAPDKQLDHDFWLAIDLPILRHADVLMILTLPQWEYSEGIGEEMDEAHRCNIPIIYLDP